MAEPVDKTMSFMPPTAAVATAPAVRDAQSDTSVVSGPPRASIRRVVIPLDGSTFAEQALGTAVTLALACGAEILLARCYSERTYLPSGSAALLGSVVEGLTPDQPAAMPVFTYHRQPLSDALAYLEHAQAEIVRPGLTVRTQAVEWPPSFAIVHLSSRPLADLVVMATHLGVNATSRHEPGSITREVIEHVGLGVPLLLVQHSSTPNALSAPVRVTHDEQRQTPAVALVHSSGGLHGAPGPRELAREYSALVAQSLGFSLVEMSLPPDAVRPDELERSVASASRSPALSPVGMFVVGGQKRAPLVADAERLLRAATVPVLVVPLA